MWTSPFGDSAWREGTSTTDLPLLNEAQDEVTPNLCGLMYRDTLSPGTSKREAIVGKIYKNPIQ